MIENDSGLSLAARFAIQPNMHNLCGDKSEQAILKRCALGFDLPQCRALFDSNDFPHLRAFLSAIARVSGQDPFSLPVVESYWFGSELTKTTFNNGREVLVPLYDQPLPALPQHFYLTHLSQVALIAASGYPKKEKAAIINQCMIACGQVIYVDNEKKSAVVRRQALKKNEGTGYRVIMTKQNVNFDPDLTPPIHLKNFVAIHLGSIAHILTDNQYSDLSMWTRKVAKQI